MNVVGVDYLDTANGFVHPITHYSLLIPPPGLPPFPPICYN